MTKQLQKEIDQNLANELARLQAIRDRVNDVKAKVDAYATKDRGLQAKVDAYYRNRKS